MVLEEQRFIHEDLERLEQAVADRVGEEPRNVSSNKLASLRIIYRLQKANSLFAFRFAIASLETTRFLIS